MAIRDTQRVGVFSESTVSKEVMGFPGTCWPMGIVAQVDTSIYEDEEIKPFAIQIKEDAYNIFGKDSEMSKLVEIVTLIGVNRLVCVPVLPPEDGEVSKAEYKAALDVLYNEDAPKIIITDSPDADVHLEIRNHCDKASDNRKERRAHVGAMAESISFWTGLAMPINSGRVTLWGSIPLDLEGNGYDDSVYLAAACAAYDALELDPAMPLHNIQIHPDLFGGLYNRFDDEDLEALYGNGISACRNVNGRIFIDRWVTTYTEDDGVNPPVEDDKYQEGTVAKIKDYIDEGLRNYLSTLHPRVKASVNKMNEVKSDVTKWLLEQEEAEIIEGVNVYKIERQKDKRTRFHVYYSYSVVLPLNTIFLHGKALV